MVHLLFWLSMTPVAPGWMGENDFASATLALYGAVLFMSSVAFIVLQANLIAVNGRGLMLAQAVGHGWKGKVSMGLYCVGITSRFFSAWVSGLYYVVVTLI